jgi:shikimate kinase
LKVPLSEKNIVLVGFMGSGKSAVGKKLAKALGVGFQDLDRWVEQRAGSSITQIFKKKGEGYFRKREREGICALTKLSPMVMATGGGAWMDPVNRRHLKNWGKIVWLKVRFQTAWARVSKNKARRPLVGLSAGPSAEFVALFKKRQKIYSRADLALATDDRSPDQSCKMLLKKLKLGRSL